MKNTTQFFTYRMNPVIRIVVISQRLHGNTDILQDVLNINVRYGSKADLLTEPKL